MDYKISGYFLHPVNFGADICRGFGACWSILISKSTIQIDGDIRFEEICLLDVFEGVFGCCYRSPAST